MTVAAAIEIGAGGTPAPGLGRAPGAAHSSGHAGAAAFDLLSSTVSAATSFRANWQSLLVTLHSSMQEFSEAEAGPSLGSAATALASAQTSDTSSASSLTAGMDLRLVQGTETESLETGAGSSVKPGNEQGSGQSGAGAKLSPVSARAGANVIQSAAVVAKPVSSKSEGMKPVAKQGAESARGSRSARSIKVAKPEAVLAKLVPGVAKPNAIPAGPLPDMLPVASSGLVQAVPAATSVIPVARGIGEQAQLAQTKISADRLTDPLTASTFVSASSSTSVSTSSSASVTAASVSDFSSVSDSVSASASASSSASLNTQAPDKYVPGRNISAVNASVLQTVNEPAMSAKPEPVSSVSNLSGTSGLSRRETITTVAGNISPLHVTLYAEGGNQPETSAPNQSLTQATPQTEAPNTIPAETIAPSHDLIQTQDVRQSPIQTETSSTNTVQTPATRQIQAPSQNPSQPFALGQKQTLATAPSQNPLQAQVDRQSPEQTEASSINSTESPTTSQVLTTSQTSSPEFDRDQIPTPAIASNQNPMPPHVECQSPTKTEARSLNPIQAQVARQGSVQTEALSTTPAESAATIQTNSPILVPKQTPAAAPSRNSVQQQVASQSLTQTTAKSTNTLETPALNPNSTPALTSVQNRTQMYVQSQDEIPAQPVNQRVNAVANPIPGDSMNVLPAADSVAYQPVQFPAQPSVAGKPSSVRGVKSSTSEPISTTRNAGDSDSVRPARPLAEGQSSGPAADTLTMARADTSANQTVSPTGAHASDSTPALTGPDLREAFATLDAAGASEKPAWIHAGAQRAEAGFQDPALGWVGVRADLSGGGVHAQLLPGSADAAQALGGHLAGLNAYLAEHHTPVETLTLQTPLGGWPGPGSGQGAEQGMQQGTGQETAQSADASSTSGLYSDTSTQSPSASLELPALFGDMDESTQAAGLGSYHISVMA